MDDLQRAARPSFSLRSAVCRITVFLAAACVFQTPLGAADGPQASAGKGDKKDAAAPGKSGASAKKPPAGKKTKSKSKKRQTESDDSPAALISYGKHDQVPVYAGEVWQIASQLKGGPGGAAKAPPEFLAQVLEESIHRQLVALRLIDEGFELDEKEIDEVVKSFQDNLQKQEVDVAKFLAARGHTTASLRKQLAWDSAWSKFVRVTISPEAESKYFDEHRRDHDGTELRVSHILFRVEAPLGQTAPDEAALRATVEKAAGVRRQIEANELTFADAAKKYSDGPSREDGGDLNFIPRHGRMVEAFSAAAFALAKGELSEPVTTSFGVHLILCTDERPGTKTIDDVREEISQILARRLFIRLAAEVRAEARIEYADVLPHFDPVSRELVPAARPYVPAGVADQKKSSESKP